MANFYKMDPAVWDLATAALSLEEEAAYLRICNAIYKAERGCPDVPRMLAGMFRCSTRKARSLVDSLVDKGKIERRDGVLWNDKAEREILEIRKKKGGKGSNAPRIDGEPEANTPRVAGEMDAKQQRNGGERADKSLKNAEFGHGNDPPREEENREDDSRKEKIKEAFERFWKSYPRRRQESGSLTRGAKQEAETQFRRLTAEERETAIKGLAGFTRIYPDDSKAVCDAVRYLSKKRWLDVEGLDDKPAEIIPYPEGALGEKCKKLAELLGVDRYKSYLIRDGASIISEDENGVIVISVLGQFHAEQIKSKCMAALRKVFSDCEVRFETVRKKAA